jgi:hypothetical protein
MARLALDWRNYCVYSGKHLPDAAMNNEHVIPKSLGGSRSTIIRASHTLNSRFATTIDAPITKDPVVQFGRRDANARGHSRKIPVATIKDARVWKSGAPWYENERRYNLEVPKGGPPKVYDTKAGRFLPAGMITSRGSDLRSRHWWESAGYSFGQIFWRRSIWTCFERC